MHFKKTLSIFFALFIAFSVFVFPAYAVEYGTQFPEYVNISGGAFIEAQSTIGKITFVCANNFKDNYFGFSGNGSNICNISNSTISGYIYTASGNTYQARFTSFGTLQYRTGTSSYYEYIDVTITDILNTNVNFIDDKLDRQTDNYFFDKYDIFFFVIFIVICFCCVLNLFFIKRRGRN